MQLDSESIRLILRSLKSYNPGTGGRGNLRRAPRVGLRGYANILIARSTQQTAVIVRDLSEGGICIISPKSVDRGEFFTAVFPSIGGKPLLIVYKVLHCRQAANNTYCIGARLQNASQPTIDAKPATSPAATPEGAPSTPAAGVVASPSDPTAAPAARPNPAVAIPAAA